MSRRSSIDIESDLKERNDGLVGGWLTPLKDISHLGWLFPIYGKVKNVPNHQPVVNFSMERNMVIFHSNVNVYQKVRSITSTGIIMDHQWKKSMISMTCICNTQDRIPPPSSCWPASWRTKTLCVCVYVRTHMRIDSLSIYIYVISYIMYHISYITC